MKAENFVKRERFVREMGWAQCEQAENFVKFVREAGELQERYVRVRSGR